MPPNTVEPTESVTWHEVVAVVGDELDRLQNKAQVAGGRVVGQGKANPAWFDPQKATGDLFSIRLRFGPVDVQQSVPIRSRTGASGAVLNAEQMIEQRGNEIVMEAFDIEGHDSQAG